MPIVLQENRDGTTPASTLQGTILWIAALSTAELPISDEQPVETLKMELHAEDLSITKRQLPGQLVRVAAKTRTRDVLVDELLTHETAVIEYVAVGRYVDVVPDVRQEGDVTIMPVVEEEIVVTRRLFLREEVHVRKVRISKPHVETVTLREQHIVVTRETVQPGSLDRLPTAGVDTALHSPVRNMPMDTETIVAVYDTPAHAELAAADLRQAGIPESAISLHASNASIGATEMPPAREPGFWSSLFGGEAEHDTAVYDRSMASGSTVLTVKPSAAHVSTVMEILESHHPIDIDERATGFGLRTGATSTAMPMAGSDTDLITGGPVTSGYASPMTPGTSMSADETGTIQLAEESLAVGKRLLNRGGTRIRRYVVETPVEESVSLHSEKVTLERHPVTDGRPVTDASFSEKVIEMTETAEEAVVSKTARVVEEVGLRKEATDRVETIHDTVRKEEIEIEQIPGTTTTTSTTVPGTFTTPKV